MNIELLNKKEYFGEQTEFDRYEWIKEIAATYAADYKEMIIEGMREWSDQEICEEFEKIEGDR